MPGQAQVTARLPELFPGVFAYEALVYPGGCCGVGVSHGCGNGCPIGGCSDAQLIQ